ncbi:MAG: hypothetical protein AAFV19_25070 [Pseudomonadota bacterium]
MKTLHRVLAAALTTTLLGCAENQGSSTQSTSNQSGQSAAGSVLQDGIYAIRFEKSGCGELKLGEDAYYKWDSGCDGGPPDYEHRTIKHVGSSVYVEAASLKVEEVTPTGFTGTWSFRGTKEGAVGKRR